MNITTWNLSDFTQKEIQDANVGMGEARCANESRAKTEAKFVRAWNAQHTVPFVLDGVSYSLPLPSGKTRVDFLKHVLGFFACDGVNTH